MRLLTRFFNRLIVAILLVTVFLAPIRPATAQSDVTQLSALAVELWPDYDRPSMLVLLTATLPEGTALPATLTFPLPAGAEVHAVASFNEVGALMSDVDYTVENERLTLTTPSNRFRVEYYAPYETEGNDYSYTFDWISDLAIEQATVVVQQPVAATDFRLSPAAASVAERGDGLTYHTLPPRAVAAGEPFTVNVAYTMEAPALSAPPQSPVDESAISTPTQEASGATSIGIDPIWLLVGAGALALAGGAWYLGQRQGRTAARHRKPQPTRPDKKKPAPGNSSTATTLVAGQTRYCHSCGRQAQPGDTFCRNCGTQLKAD